MTSISIRAAAEVIISDTGPMIWIQLWVVFTKIGKINLHTMTTEMIITTIIATTCIMTILQIIRPPPLIEVFPGALRMII